jgi:polyisoprenoid-binding protein YceI
MPRLPQNLLLLAILLAGRPFVAPARGATRPIDVENSTMTVYASASGVLAAFGHDHEIAAPIAAGAVDPAARRVELRVDAAALRVRDPKASEKDRAEIRKTMLGPAVLDAGRHPEIRFESTAVETAGAGWTVRGNLTLHGETKPVTVEVREKDGRYVGSARVRQTMFGIQPVKAAGGTVRVKDELRIDFDIRLAPEPAPKFP